MIIIAVLQGLKKFLKKALFAIDCESATMTNPMIQQLKFIVLASMLCLLTGCASIVSKSNYPIVVDSSPSEAIVTITDRAGAEVFKGETPATVTLAAGNGYFKKARYQVSFEKTGYETKTVPIECTLDGWYFGNILFGGLIGMLIVDPNTGAMYRLEKEYIKETLTPSSAAMQKEGLKVYTLANIPPVWKNHLVELDATKE